MIRIALITLAAAALLGCDDGLDCWPGGDGLDAARAHNGLSVKGWPDAEPGGCQEALDR